MEPDSLSVIICTHERADDLARCLDALARQTVPPLEIVVVDNAPRTGETRAVVERAASSQSAVRYVVEPRAGLNRARNAGVAATAGALVAFTDDDAVPAPDWGAVLQERLRDPALAGVAGPMLPLELETEAQQMFERYLGGPAGRREQERARAFGGDFAPAWAGKVGAGANMAFRRAALERVGAFDEAFDAGTLTRSGGDTEMFGRLLTAGFTLAYEPRARVWHRHRRTMAELRSQLFGYGVGVFAYWTLRVVEYDEREALRSALATLRAHVARRLVRALQGHDGDVPPELVLAELAGCFYGPVAYFRERRRAGAHPGPDARR
ncbi:MAG TPA: glycosyltransferase [Gemmatimonadaceae bacterium]|nr:glycosyltransferase [Gemmatimonadaceae bacterium]